MDTWFVFLPSGPPHIVGWTAPPVAVDRYNYK